MDIRILRYFIAVANEQSISAAAKLLHLSQPTLSRQLKILEEELGTVLFERGNRTINLTDEGFFLLEKAKEIVDLVNKTEANFEEPDEMISGTIYIGGGETDAMHYVGKSLNNLITQFPGITFHLHSGNADDIMDKLDKGLLDFGLVIEPVDKLKYDFLKLPAVDTWGVLMRKDCPLADKPFIEPEDLLDKPLLVSSQSAVNNVFTDWIGHSSDDLTIAATYNLLHNAALMVDEQLGYAVCLDNLINTTGESTLVFRPLKPTLNANLYIIWKKHQVFSKAASAFLKQLKIDL